MTTNKVASLKVGDRIVLNNISYTVTGTHQTARHDLQVYVKNEMDQYEVKLPLLEGDKICVLSYS